VLKRILNSSRNIKIDLQNFTIELQNFVVCVQKVMVFIGLRYTQLRTKFERGGIMPLFTRCLWCPFLQDVSDILNVSVWSISSKYPTDNYVKIVLFEGDYVCPFKCKWAASPGTEGRATTAPIISSLQTRIKMSETVLPFMFKPDSNNETQETWKRRMQLDVSEWLVDEFM